MKSKAENANLGIDGLVFVHTKKSNRLEEPNVWYMEYGTFDYK
jgi:hypothetical protein